MPIAGMRKKPAATAPRAAPAVFAAYKPPASAAPVEYHAAAMGKVAPIAAAGSPIRTRLVATRAIANRIGAPPSAYDHRSAGTHAARSIGRTTAIAAMAISSAA